VVKHQPSKQKCLSLNARTTEKELKAAGHRWLTPIILANQEAEIIGLQLKARPSK
jgi:hypothetical protein